MIDKESYMPYYLQIYNDLKHKIDSVVYRTGEMLPSENDLVDQYNVTRSTVRSALNKLKENGMIYTEKGKGSFVNSPKVVQELNSIYTFGDQFYRSGSKVENKIISIVKEQGSSSVRLTLNIEENDTITVMKILRKLDSVPSVFQVMYLPTSIMPDTVGFDIKVQSIYDFLEARYGIHIERAKEYIDPVLADGCISEILEVEDNTPLLFTERIAYAEGGIPVELRQCYIRNDKVRFSVDLY